MTDGLGADDRGAGGPGAAIAASQRQHLVLLFTDLTDSTRIAAAMEPELYADLLQQLRQLMASIVPRHGGEIVRIDGDGALCIFGYPVAHEDAGRRATEAALDLHAAAAALDAAFAGAGVRIRMHSGVHGGVVLLRVGDLVRGRYEMLGDATNIAARLCDHAASDQVVVSEGTLGTDRHFFRTGARHMLALSGREQPIAVYPVVGRTNKPTRLAARAAQGLTPLVGRGALLADTAAWLAGSAPGQAASTRLLCGPPGIGKSRLLAEIAARAQGAGWLVAHGYCEAYLAASPLQPFRQLAAALRAQMGAASEYADEAAREPGDIAAMLDRIAPQQPVLLLIDDWQWSDDASRQALRRLLDRAAAPPLRIVIAARESPDWLAHDPAVQTIAVDPLPPGDAERLIAALLPHADQMLVERIGERAGGTPLWVEELCHITRGQGQFLAGEPNTGSWFDFAVQARLAQLSSPAAALLRLAGTVGPVSPLWLLSAVQGQAIAPQLLDELAQADFLYPGQSIGTLRFKHGLTRDIVYAGIGRRERLTAHRAIVAALEERSRSEGVNLPVDMLAWHSHAGEDPPRALHYAMLAGDAALKAAAFDRAQGHFRVAFDQLQRLHRPDAAPAPDYLPMLRRIIRGYGRACVIDPDRANAPGFTAMTRAAEASGDREAIALASYWQGAHDYGLGEPRRSLAALRVAQQHVDAQSAPGFAVQLLANLGQSSAIAGRYADAFGYMEQFLAARTAAGPPQRASVSLAYCLSCRGLIRADIGDFADAEADFRAAMAALHGEPLPIGASILSQQALGQVFAENFGTAIAIAAEAEAIATKARATFLIQAAQVIRGYAEWRHAESETGFNAFVEATLRLHHSAQFQRMSYKYGWLAEAMAARGETGMARQFILLALQRAQRGDRLGEANAERAMAHLAAGGAARHGPAHYLRRADTAAAKRSSHREAALNRRCARDLGLS